MGEGDRIKEQLSQLGLSEFRIQSQFNSVIVLLKIIGVEGHFKWTKSTKNSVSQTSFL